MSAPDTTETRESSFARSRLAGGRLRTLLCLFGVLAGLVVTGLAWVVASPIGSSPDDDFHQTSIWCLTAGPGSACETRYMIDGTQAVKTFTALQKPCFATHVGRSAGCQELTTELGFTERVNTGSYPTGYYSFLHLFASDRVIISVLAMRAVNVLLFVAIMAGVAMLAGAAVRRSMLLALSVTMIPVGVFLVASLNPSAWGITGITALFFSLLALRDASTRLRTLGLGAMAALGAGLAAMSRGDAGAYAVAVTGIGAWLIWPTLRRRPWRLLALVLPVVFGLLSFRGSGQTQAYGASTFTTEAVVLNLLEVLKLPLGNLGLGTQGTLGWLDTPMPAVTWGGMAIAFGVVLVLGLAASDWRRLVAAGGTEVLLIGLPMYVLQLYGYRVGEFVQPRYLLPLLIVLLGIVAWPTPGRRPWLSRRIAVALAALVTAAHSAALYTNLIRYVNGSWAYPLGSDTQWWWDFGFGPLAVWGVGSLAFAVCAVLVLVGAARHLDKGEERSGEGDGPSDRLGQRSGGAD